MEESCLRMKRERFYRISLCHKEKSEIGALGIKDQIWVYLGEGRYI